MAETTNFNFLHLYKSNKIIRINRLLYVINKIKFTVVLLGNDF